MRILIIGAGVLGSVYAARLHENGAPVTVLARGERLRDVRAHGVRLCDETTGEVTTADVNVIDRLDPEDPYELVLVLVRRNQVTSVLPMLAVNRHTPNIVLMTNNAAGYDDLVAALGRDRVLLGFPGAGGAIEDGVVHYRLAPKQPTTIGEIDGADSERLHAIAAILRAAGFPVTLCPTMDAWLKSHAAAIVPVAGAIYKVGGSTHALASDDYTLTVMFHAIREAFHVLRALGVPIVPVSHCWLGMMPDVVLTPLIARRLATERAELIMARHAMHARDEMLTLADEFSDLIARANIPTPAWDELAMYIRSPERVPALI
jgi:2-dehydropantoate 2-reductase